MEVAARQLVPEIVRAAPGWRFTAFVNHEAVVAGTSEEDWLGGCAVVAVRAKARNRVKLVAAEQAALPRLAALEGVDLLHSLANTGPARGRFRRVVTVHDLIHRTHPDAHFGVRAFGMRALVPLAARRSDRVIAPSRATRDDIVRLIGLDPERIDVVPNGLGAVSSMAPTAEAELRARLGVADRPIALAVSAKRPHKNLARLLDALALIDVPQRPLLVVPGYPTPHEDELRRRAAALGIAAEVRFLPWVGDADLEGLYRLAAVSVFPSLYEGFGLPVLESMRRGVPVVCSDIPSLREVAGDAALRFDPADAEAIAAALTRATRDEDLRRELVERGRLRAARFTWGAAAEGTIASYGRALGTA
jgi:glycosyltransferase involved in cell wall biosynthesis